MRFVGDPVDSFPLDLDLSELLHGSVAPATLSPVRSEFQALRSTSPKFTPVLLRVLFTPK